VACINSGFDKNYAVSHFFRFEGQGETNFAFTFPLQHYVKQTVGILADARYDTAENACTSVTNKFISPGLPGTAERLGEVTLLPVSKSLSACDDSEGWIAYELSADDAVSTVTNPNYPNGGTYTPAAFGKAVNFGLNDSTAPVISISPLQWTQYSPWRETGTFTP
jgi:hypothetical protein